MPCQGFAKTRHSSIPGATTCLAVSCLVSEVDAQCNALTNALTIHGLMITRCVRFSAESLSLLNSAFELNRVCVGVHSELAKEN